MSWTAVYKVDGKAIEYLTKMDSNGLDTIEHRHQHDAALIAAAEILVTGSVGDEDKVYAIHISGHGNPDHQPTEGCTNDYITVTVIQA